MKVADHGVKDNFMVRRDDADSVVRLFIAKCSAAGPSFAASWRFGQARDVGLDKRFESIPTACIPITFLARSHRY